MGRPRNAEIVFSIPPNAISTPCFFRLFRRKQKDFDEIKKYVNDWIVNRELKLFEEVKRHDTISCSSKY